MKKILLFGILFFFAVSFSANAQTTAGNLIAKLKFAPKNQYGVQRVDYGTWDTAANANHTWAVYSPKDHAYLLCLSHGQSVYCIDLIAKCMEAEKILKDYDLKKWTKVTW